MVRSQDFSKATAYVGLSLAVFGYCFWIPGAGAIFRSWAPLAARPGPG
ncbi:MAG: hypothetical protein JXB35_10580 [Anaerolineae bacterium]|nr:hypothetical protein [Anaerolineae bacterium]